MALLFKAATAGNSEVWVGWTRKSFGDAARRSSSDARPSDDFVRRLSNLLDLPSRLAVWMDQVHGTKIQKLNRPAPRGFLSSTDGCLTSASNLALFVRTADCLPILLYDDRCRSICALHAGWRGLLGGIVSKGVSEICAAAACGPAKIFAVFGPSIQMSCYEIGEEVRQSFVDAYGQSIGRFFRRRQKSLRMSLQGLAVRQLVMAGLRISCIKPSRHCTACLPKEYYSFRARKDAGRIAAYIFKR